MGFLEVGNDDFVYARVPWRGPVLSDSRKGPRPHRGTRSTLPFWTTGDGHFSVGYRADILAGGGAGARATRFHELAENGASLARDPYRRGWICALSPKNLGASLRKLKVAEEAVEWLRNERERFDEFAAARTWRNAVPGTAMADGGKPADGIMNYLDDEAWAAFGREFLGQSEAEPGR